MQEGIINSCLIENIFSHLAITHLLEKINIRDIKDINKTAMLNICKKL